jgi:hypothetical protein
MTDQFLPGRGAVRPLSAAARWFLFESAWPVRLAVAVSIALAAIYALQIVAYLYYPNNYVDHAQAGIAAIGWLAVHGAPIYPDWDSGDVYGTVYGPLLYFLNGGVLLFGPSILISKLPGVVALAAATGMFCVLVQRRAGSAAVTVLLAGALFAVIGHFAIAAYWNRADPFLMLSAMLALYAANRLPPVGAALAVGVLAGIAGGFKIHGVLYVLPAALMVLAAATCRRDRVIVAAAGLGAGAAVLLLPFAAPQAELAHYLFYLRFAAGQGLSLHLLGENVGFAAAMLAPVVIMLLGRRARLATPDRFMIAGLLVAIAATATIAAKPGAGAFHLMPFAAIALYAFAVMLGPAGIAAPRIAAAVFAVAFACYLQPLLARTGPLALRQYRSAATTQMKIAELGTLLAGAPGAQIGPTDRAHYDDTFYRAIAVFTGHGLKVDFAAWMDLRHSGAPESRIVRYVTGCDVPFWIFPLGEPFAMPSFYTDEPMFSDDFRRRFHDNYRLARTGRFFQVWTCRAASR